ncbi:MAG TPA: hypothetical protein VKP67_28190, partial [Xanthobacteraceae bacterium]|nr:hypothetical protein [Xanthobacteraceae bacterium]
MSVLIWDDEILAAVKTLVAEAHTKPLVLSEVRRLAVPDQNKFELALEDRKELPPTKQIVIGSYHCAYSCEEHPGGLCRHLSVSVSTPGKLPNVPAVTQLMDMFGFDRKIKPTIWLEEFEPGHKAVNLLQLL